jgi:hypothetical protein
MKAEPIEIRQYFQPALRARPVRVKLGVGSFLTFEFGPRSRAYGHLRAQWRLWIYLSNWTLFHGDRRLVDSDTDRKRIAVIAHRLEEEAALTDVRFDVQSQATTFSFEDFRLVVSPADYLDRPDERDSYWMFFMPGNEVLAVGPSGPRLEHRSDRHPSAELKKEDIEQRRQVRLED